MALYPEIGKSYTEEYINVNFPDLKEQCTKLIEAGLDARGKQLYEVVIDPKEGGGGGGTSDYSQLSNKPSINGVQLSGNKTADELGVLNVVPQFLMTATEYSTRYITEDRIDELYRVFKLNGVISFRVFSTYVAHAIEYSGVLVENDKLMLISIVYVYGDKRFKMHITRGNFTPGVNIDRSFNTYLTDNNIVNNTYTYDTTRPLSAAAGKGLDESIKRRLYKYSSNAIHFALDYSSEAGWMEAGDIITILPETNSIGDIKTYRYNYSDGYYNPNPDGSITKSHIIIDKNRSLKVLSRNYTSETYIYWGQRYVTTIQNSSGVGKLKLALSGTEYNKYIAYKSSDTDVKVLNIKEGPPTYELKFSTTLLSSLGETPITMKEHKGKLYLTTDKNIYTLNSEDAQATTWDKHNVSDGATGFGSMIIDKTTEKLWYIEHRGTDSFLIKNRLDFGLKDTVAAVNREIIYNFNTSKYGIAVDELNKLAFIANRTVQLVDLNSKTTTDITITIEELIGTENFLAKAYYSIEDKALQLILVYTDIELVKCLTIATYNNSTNSFKLDIHNDIKSVAEKDVGDVIEITDYTAVIGGGENYIASTCTIVIDDKEFRMEKLATKVDLFCRYKFDHDKTDFIRIGGATL